MRHKSDMGGTVNVLNLTKFEQKTLRQNTQLSLTLLYRKRMGIAIVKTHEKAVSTILPTGNNSYILLFLRIFYGEKARMLYQNIH